MPFFGRSAELSELSTIVLDADPDVRLVTVTGAPGIGKTRLLAELARERSGIFVALDGVRDPGDAFAAAAGAESLDRALAGLSGAPRLVVLDGGDARALAEKILASSVDAIVLVGSRSPLGVAGERIVSLGPLDPESAAAMLEDSIRARGAQIPDRDRPLLAELVRDLEGIPLALELAAARVPVMGLRPLVHRLRSRASDVLHGLASAIDGSWQSADAKERAALAGATVFRGGFTLEAAEGILDTSAEVLEALLSRSLVHRTNDGRLALFGPVREFAAQHLSADEAARVKQRHVDWYAMQAPKADGAWLLAERENLLAVIASVLEAGPVTPRRAEPALRVLVTALPVLVGTAPLDAFDALLDPVLEATKASGVDALLLVRVLMTRGVLRRHRGRTREGAEDLVRALAIVRASASPERAPVEGEILRELGWVFFQTHKTTEARDHFSRALAIAEQTGDLAAQARALAAEATVLHSLLELDQAAALLERAIALHGGDSADDLHGLGAVRRDQVRHAESRKALSRALELATAQGDRRKIAGIHASRGLLELDAGDLDTAKTALEAAAAGFGDLGAEPSQGIALGTLGILARLSGKSADAWALLRQAVQQCGDSQLGIVFTAHLAALDEEAGRHGVSKAALEALAKHDLLPVASAVLAKKSAPSAMVRITERCAKGAAILPPDDALVVAGDGTWFRMPGGSRVALDRRRPLARMLAAMARAPSTSFTSAALLEAGWPSEKVLAAAGAHRVRVGIATMRKLGLRDALKTTEDGYALVGKIHVIDA